MDSGSWLAIALMLQDQVVRDTVVMIPGDRGFMETLAVTGQFVVSVVVLVLLGALVFVLLAMRKSVHELTKLLTASSGDISAAAHSVRHVAEDVRGITQSVKTDVGAMSERSSRRGVILRCRARCDLPPRRSGPVPPTRCAAADQQVLPNSNIWSARA